MSDQQAFRNYAKFYPDHLEEHSDTICLRLHLIDYILAPSVALRAVYRLIGAGEYFATCLSEESGSKND